MGCLYRLTSPSGKQYIGIAHGTAHARWLRHIRDALKDGADFAISRAIRKYGPESFRVETLVIAERPFLFELERRAIAKFQTKAPNGYNLSDGGESGAKGAKWSPEKRAKHSAQLRASWASGKRKSPAPKNREHWKDPVLRARWIARLPEQARACWADPEIGAKMRQAVREANNRPEVRAQRRTLAKKQWERPEVREKMIAAMRGKKRGPQSPETKAKRSAALRRFWANPEHRRQKSEACKKVWTPERRAQASSTLRRVHAAKRQQTMSA